MKNIVLVVIVSIFIQGCTSIAQPTASRPLVEHKFVTATEPVVSSLGVALSNNKSGTDLVVGIQPAIMGDRYFAATGLSCRKLTLQQQEQQIYCLNSKGNWFKIKQVISEYNENDMPEGSL